ncbi:MAG TPA: ATP-binding protein [Myxococcota bacterium]|nr:ATP-binding protein [Myxococcota bacterium]
MASVVAHEVRNPLNSIALNVDLLREMLEGPGRDPARALDVLRAVQGEVDRLAEITEEYLRFGRMPKGVMAACDLGRVLRETRDFMEGEFAAAGIAVRTELPDVPLRVRTDEGQFRQALINILRNAVEAMPDGGTLTLRAAEQDDRVVVAVADTGVGIPDAFKARLFEPFATTKPRGTGLGLAFVQQVVQESGGDVSIDSAPGRGTTISMVLRRAG